MTQDSALIVCDLLLGSLFVFSVDCEPSCSVGVRRYFPGDGTLDWCDFLGGFSSAKGSVLHSAESGLRVLL